MRSPPGRADRPVPQWAATGARLAHHDVNPLPRSRRGALAGGRQPPRRGRGGRVDARRPRGPRGGRAREPRRGARGARRRHRGRGAFCARDVQRAPPPASFAGMLTSCGSPRVSAREGRARLAGGARGSAVAPLRRGRRRDPLAHAALGGRRRHLQLARARRHQGPPPRAGRGARGAAPAARRGGRRGAAAAATAPGAQGWGRRRPRTLGGGAPARPQLPATLLSARRSASREPPQAHRELARRPRPPQLASTKGVEAAASWLQVVGSTQADVQRALTDYLQLRPGRVTDAAAAIDRERPGTSFAALFSGPLSLGWVPLRVHSWCPPHTPS